VWSEWSYGPYFDRLWPNFTDSWPSLRINIVYEKTSFTTADLNNVCFDATALVQATWRIKTDRSIGVVLHASDGNGGQLVDSTEAFSLFRLRHNVLEAWSRLKPDPKLAQEWIPQILANARGEVTDVKNDHLSLYPDPEYGTIKSKLKQIEKSLNEWPRRRGQGAAKWRLPYTSKERASENVSCVMLNMLGTLCKLSKHIKETDHIYGTE
jgi:hypothetical protein